ncbi:hypothetical protein BHM03_00026912 [Ensete ventricosum]|nr:hypothetical protein BHM03_00026912 [Ensete ventricosum]
MVIRHCAQSLTTTWLPIIRPLRFYTSTAFPLSLSRHVTPLAFFFFNFFIERFHPNYPSPATLACVRYVTTCAGWGLRETIAFVCFGIYVLWRRVELLRNARGRIPADRRRKHCARIEERRRPS